MKKLFSLIFLVSSISMVSQAPFVKGYYIDQNNNKNEGYIQDTNPYNSPEKINFKSTEQGNSNEVLISDIKEFKTFDGYKYVRYTVDYDYGQVVNKSEVNIYGKEPNLKKKTVLLKVLIEGSATLYKAIIDDFVFFYYKTKDIENPILLIHRKYNDNNVINENNDFRKQLYNDLKSEKLPIGEFLNLPFNENDLVGIFKKVNNQDNSLVEQHVVKEKVTNKLYYKIIGGVSSFTSPYEYNGNINMKSPNSDFSNPMIGFELSNVFATNFKRSELFGRLFYQSVKTEGSYHEETNGGYNIDYVFKAKITSLNLTAGYRYAFIKTGKNKAFVDGSIGVSTPLSGNMIVDYAITYTGANPNPSITDQYVFDKYSTIFVFNIGAGYAFNNKYALGVEYSFPKNYLSRYTNLSGGFSNINLMFTYTLNK